MKLINILLIAMTLSFASCATKKDCKTKQCATKQCKMKKKDCGKKCDMKKKQCDKQCKKPCCSKSKK